MTGAVIKPKVTEIREALETVLKIDRDGEALELELNCDHRECIDIELGRLIDIELGRLDELRRLAISQLGSLISAHAGPPPWTVLVAGHLIFRWSSETVIVPIESVVYLDNLRRFP